MCRHLLFEAVSDHILEDLGTLFPLFLILKALSLVIHQRTEHQIVGAAGAVHVAVNHMADIYEAQVRAIVGFIVRFSSHPPTENGSGYLS